jgi:hypothetical protein
LTLLEKITQPLLEISKRGVRRDRIIHHDHLVAVVCWNRHGMPIAGRHGLQED